MLDLWVKYDGNALAAPPSDPASVTTLVRSPTAANLIRVFKLQERLKGLGKDDTFAAKHVHVVGAGTMGGDIAAWCALRGLTVTLQDQNAKALSPAIARAGKLFTERLRDPRKVRDATDRLIPDVAGNGIARADVIIEAIFENAEAKRALFAAVEKKARPDAILATNTSSIPLEEIASALQDPTRLVGIHFFNPVSRMMLVEIVHGRATERRIRERGRRVRAADRQAAVAGEERARIPGEPDPRALHDGRVPRGRRRHRAGNRRRGGAGVRHADGTDRARGHRGPRHRRRRRQAAGRAATTPPRKLIELVEAGHVGKKSGRGFYVWTNGKPAKQPAGAVPAGLADRLVQPFVAEAKAALADGIVDDADLVDAGAIFGTGFAPFRGGPLHYASAARERPVDATAEPVPVV